MKAIAFIFQWQNGKFVQVLPGRRGRLGQDRQPQAELVKLSRQAQRAADGTARS